MDNYSNVTFLSTRSLVHLSRYGEEISFQCLAGYEQLSGDTSHLCDSDGKLSGVTIMCAKVKCGSLPSISNTIVTANTTGDFNDTISYACAEDHRMIGGSTTRKCTEDKIWTGDPLVCEQKMCGTPPDVENTTFTVQDTTINSIALYVIWF